MNYWIGVVSHAHVQRGVVGSFAQSAPIKPLIGQLDFIANKTHWGAAFRFGQIKIGPADFRRIVHAMDCQAWVAEASDDLCGDLGEQTQTLQRPLF